MTEEKMYKTKLCMMYQRGRCTHHHCNFAHGDAELRRPFDAGRQDLRGRGDLRERLDRTHSPSHYSSGRRDAKDRHTSRGDRNTRKGKQVFGQDDHSGRNSEGSEGQIKDRRLLLDQLRETHSEINHLKNDKQQLEMYLDDRVKAADSLTFEIHELEKQLSKEKDEGKRVTTKIKKFIKAHNRHFRLQDELKRSEAQLRELGEQLELEGVTSDAANPFYEGQSNASPRKKRSRFSLEAPDASNEVRGRTESGKIRAENLRRSKNHNHLSNSKKPEADSDTYYSHEEKSRRSSPPAEKHDKLELALTLSSKDQNANLQYEGDDENVDVDGVDEEKVDVDVDGI